MASSNYELILMLDPQTADEQREKIASDTKGRLEAQGTVEHEANWGPVSYTHLTLPTILRV